MKRIAPVAILIAAVFALPRDARGQFDFSTPKTAYESWVNAIREGQGDHEPALYCYSQRLHKEVKEKADKTDFGHNLVAQQHIDFANRLPQYQAAEPRLLSNTEAVITLQKHGASDKTTEVRLVREEDGWKIDGFPFAEEAEESDAQARGWLIAIIAGMIVALFYFVARTALSSRYRR
ncbi:MAG: hypothetical protein AB1696_05840 [Planctomycetota bacterium]